MWIYLVSCTQVPLTNVSASAAIEPVRTLVLSPHTSGVFSKPIQNCPRSPKHSIQSAQQTSLPRLCTYNIFWDLKEGLTNMLLIPDWHFATTHYKEYYFWTMVAAHHGIGACRPVEKGRDVEDTEKVKLHHNHSLISSRPPLLHSHQNFHQGWTHIV